MLYQFVQFRFLFICAPSCVLSSFMFQFAPLKKILLASNRQDRQSFVQLYGIDKKKLILCVLHFFYIIAKGMNRRKHLSATRKIYFAKYKSDIIFLDFLLGLIEFTFNIASSRFAQTCDLDRTNGRSMCGPCDEGYTGPDCGE